MARLAGLMGIVVLALGYFAHSVNAQLIDLGDNLKTGENLTASELLFRFGFVSGLAMEVVFIMYAILLLKLLKPVNKSVSAFILLLALIQVPIFLLNKLNQFAAFLSAKQQAIDQMIFFIYLHKHGGLIVSIFFGLWLLPLGYLVFKSGYFPKILRILLMIGCFGFLTSFIQGFLLPDSEATLWTNPALIVTHISELLMMLWLLFKGVNIEQWNRSIVELNKTSHK